MDRRFKNVHMDPSDRLKYDELMEKALIEREKRIAEKEIEAINNEENDDEASSTVSYWSDRIRNMTTSKILMYLILLNCFVIEVYSMCVMAILKDLSALYSLIGAVVTSSVTFAIYCAKSYKGKRSEVDAQLARDKFEAELAENLGPEVADILDDSVSEEDDVIMEESDDCNM